MIDMTQTTFNAESHPREAASGRFTQAVHTAPEAQLPVEPIRSTPVQDAIDKITGGRATLERELRSGVFNIDTLLSSRHMAWANAGGPEVDEGALGVHLHSLDSHLTGDDVERVLEVAINRAASGQYTAARGGTLNRTPVDALALRAADRRAAELGDYVSRMWESDQKVGPEAELTDQDARLFAEVTLQTLPKDLPIHRFPRLSEFANATYTEAGGASRSKVDALLAEIALVRSRISHMDRSAQTRLDMLSTFAVHALPGQD